jgi:hypothetical protein
MAGVCSVIRLLTTKKIPVAKRACSILAPYSTTMHHDMFNNCFLISHILPNYDSAVYIYVCIALEQLSMLPSNFYMTICGSSSFIIKPEILPAHKTRGSRVCGGPQGNCWRRMNKNSQLKTFDRNEYGM